MQLEKGGSRQPDNVGTEDKGKPVVWKALPEETPDVLIGKGGKKTGGRTRTGEKVGPILLGTKGDGLLRRGGEGESNTIVGP